MIENLTQAQIEKFDALIDLEQEVRCTKAQFVFAASIDERYAVSLKMRRAQDTLYAAIDALTPRELDEFAVYRGHATRGMTS